MFLCGFRRLQIVLEVEETIDEIYKWSRTGPTVKRVLCIQEMLTKRVIEQASGKVFQ